MDTTQDPKSLYAALYGLQALLVLPYHRTREPQSSSLIYWYLSTVCTAPSAMVT
jgi:hypothetical protein